MVNRRPLQLHSQPQTRSHARYIWETPPIAGSHTSFIKRLEEASHRVLHGSLGVAAAGRGGPLVPAGPGLGDAPAAGLLDPVAAAAARAAVAGAGPAALVVGEGVLEVAAAGVPGAGREGARPVADLD